MKVVLGPNGFHRHFTGDLRALRGERAPGPDVRPRYDVLRGSLYVALRNTGSAPATITLEANAYGHESRAVTVPPRGEAVQSWSLRGSGQWYDFTATVASLPGYSRRFAGRTETGRDTWSDPAMGGVVLGEQLEIA